LREKLQKEQSELESLRKLLREREVELEATFKDVDLHKAEVARWENRVSEVYQMDISCLFCSKEF
jgi:predicted  nucleic acid-binding Zn-ribbon protein